jgi:hypothetical protein
VFGEEVSARKAFSLHDPRFTRPAPRTDERLDMVFRCVLSSKGHPYFRCNNTELGDVAVFAEGTPADLVGKVGYLTIAAYAGTEFVPSKVMENTVMPSKPVKFVDFRA